MPWQREDVERVAEQVRSALETADLSAFSELLDPDVRWGAPGDPSPACMDRAQVLSWYQRGLDAGVRARVAEIAVLDDRADELPDEISHGSDHTPEAGEWSLRSPAAPASFATRMPTMQCHSKRPISGDSDDHHAGDARREKLLASVCCLATIRSFAHSLSLPAISCTS